jgi:hypothetical protein
VASGLFALGVGGAAGASIVLNQAAPGADIIGTVGAVEYFRISIDPATGVVTFSQSLNVWHANTLSDDDTSTLTLANAANLQVVQTVTDADGDKDTASLNLGAGVFQIEDDGPNAVVANATPDTLVLDETRPVGTEEDGDSAPAGLATVTANFADNFAAPPDFGSDGPGSASYSLVLTGSNVASGLFALGVGGAAGASIVLNQAAPGADIIGTVGVVEYFRISIDPGTGVVTFSQSTNVWHANTLSDDDTSTLTLANAADLQVVQTVTDADGDKDTAGINLGAGVFQIEDDGPDVIAKTDLIYANSNNDGAGPLPGGTGIYDYDIGSDEHTSYPNASNSDFSTILLSGKVGDTQITSPVVTWDSEDADSALFNFTFNYGLASASGTLTFDKVAGTYTVELAEPFASALSTGNPNTGFTGYVAGTNTVDASGLVDVSVAQLASNFFIQFTGFAEPGGGAGVNNLQAIPPLAPLDTTLPIEDQTYMPGDVFKQAAAKVSVSGSAAGVASDTMQPGEVLDFDFFQSNPTGFTALTPTAQASSIFMVFDLVGATTDLVVILKLVDPVTNAHTTKALVVDAEDIFKQGDIIPAGFPGLDNNDGLIIIQSNDYNFGSDNWVIEGAQVLTSTEGVSGTGIDFDRELGPTGGSTDGADSLGLLTSDNDNVKITSLGVVTTTTQDAELTFLVANVDADGDNTAPQVLNVTIEGSTTFTGGSSDESIQGTAGIDTISGNGGADTMNGGAGFDKFVFAAVSDSLPGTTGNVANYDTINDFAPNTNTTVNASGVHTSPNGDILSLTAVDANTALTNDQAFTFVDNPNPTNNPGAVAHSLTWWQDVAHNETIIYADVNGNTTPDFELHLTGVQTITAHYFDL